MDLSEYEIQENPNFVKAVNIERGFWGRIFSLTPWKKYKTEFRPNMGFQVIGNKTVVCHPEMAVLIRAEIQRRMNGGGK